MEEMIIGGGGGTRVWSEKREGERKICGGGEGERSKREEGEEEQEEEESHGSFECGRQRENERVEWVGYSGVWEGGIVFILVRSGWLWK